MIGGKAATAGIGQPVEAWATGIARVLTESGTTVDGHLPRSVARADHGLGHLWVRIGAVQGRPSDGYRPTLNRRATSGR